MNKTTMKQIIANRLNAMNSTGPITEDGKSRAAINGMRHGLTGHAFLLTDEDRKAWNEFSRPIIADLKPVGPLEKNFAYLIAQAHYRLNRIHSIEENTFTVGHYNQAGAFEADNEEIHNAVTHVRVFDMKGNVFKNLSLYEQRISREMRNNLKSLKELQAERKAEERLAAKEVQTVKTKTASAGNGFGFSNAQSSQPDLPNRDCQGAATSPPEDKIAA